VLCLVSILCQTSSKCQQTHAKFVIAMINQEKWCKSICTCSRHLHPVLLRTTRWWGSKTATSLDYTWLGGLITMTNMIDIQGSQHVQHGQSRILCKTLRQYEPQKISLICVYDGINVVNSFGGQRVCKHIPSSFPQARHNMNASRSPLPSPRLLNCLHSQPPPNSKEPRASNPLRTSKFKHVLISPKTNSSRRSRSLQQNGRRQHHLAPLPRLHAPHHALIAQPRSHEQHRVRNTATKARSDLPKLQPHCTRHRRRPRSPPHRHVAESSRRHSRGRVC
jgi:hypothetical protein